MGKYAQIIQKILSGKQDASINFSDAVAVLQTLGFSRRIKGDHHVFYREDIEEIINIQPDGSKAKPYQIKQIRQIIVKYRLEAKDE